jgi:NitT/TauT family transport system ATP-binding protein
VTGPEVKYAGSNGHCLNVRGVGKSFRVNGHRPVALSQVSFAVRRGEILAILGPSGCGKTTLLNIIAGFLPADQGSVLVRGRPVSGPGPDRAVVFQEDALFPWLTAAENIAFGLKRLPLDKAERRERVERFLALVGLEGYGGYLPQALSGGMKQRVALARVLVLEPELLLMDEPFASLDAQTRWEMHQLLTSLQADLAQTVVLVTHDLEEAVKLADRVLVMEKLPGRIQREFAVDLGRPREMDSPEFISLKKEIFLCLSPA